MHNSGNRESGQRGLFQYVGAQETTTSIEPIKKTSKAKPHSPVYRMHRYFARRPYSVFADLISHYSNPNEVILDPFCGGGVTLVEGALQDRQVIGFDINPLATFVTRMELLDIDLAGLKDAGDEVIREFKPVNDRLFTTTCRKCNHKTPALWYEHSAITHCPNCESPLIIAIEKKCGLGKWQCPECGNAVRSSPNARTNFIIVNVLYSCEWCGHREVTTPSKSDSLLTEQIEKDLFAAEQDNLWIPNDRIPDCNMQRESALFKKDILQFRQFFTSRHLLALGHLHEMIAKRDDPFKEWLFFTFSSTLRYTNRMVTRNPSWRGDRPFEWSKPGFWLPTVHLEANVLQEFLRRMNAVLKGKKDYLSKLSQKPKYVSSAQTILGEKDTVFHVSARSATCIPLPDECVDAIITDPPYGSYVHYADLCNFWSVWLPEIDGLGRIIDDSEEAVIARKNFPGSKSAKDYQQILERCFLECFRVLKPERFMVLTFHNREPRAWATLLVSINRAGFEIPRDGVIFQEGISSYRHTIQSRRKGSVRGDFILSFRKPSVIPKQDGINMTKKSWITEMEFVNAIRKVLERKGPLTPDELIQNLYLTFIPIIAGRVQTAVSNGEEAVDSLIEDFDSIQLLDSHRRALLEEYFAYENGKWSIEGR